MIRFTLPILLVLITCTHAFAAEDVQNDEARASFQEGVQAFDEGRVSEALIAFQRAYSLRPSYRILYNIGQAQTELGLTLQAIDSFQRYLDEGKNNIDQRRKVEVEAELKRLKHIANIHDAPSAPKARKKKAAVKVEAKIDTKVDTKDNRTFATKGLPWMSTGLALVSLTAGAICGGRAAGLNNTLNDACNGSDCPPGRSDDIDKMGGLAVAADILFVTTAVLTTTAITLFVVGKKKRKKADK